MLQPAPFQCTSPIHTSFEALPHALHRSAALPEGTVFHATPFQCRIVPLAPAAQTSPLLRAHTAFSWLFVTAANVLPSVPFQCRIVPLTPTAQTSFALVPETPVSGLTANVCDQSTPFQWTMTPLVNPMLPTAQTSFALLPQTACSASLRPSREVDGVQLVPFQWRIAPDCPTAQTSLGAFAQIGRASCR